MILEISNSKDIKKYLRFFDPDDPAASLKALTTILAVGLTDFIGFSFSPRFIRLSSSRFSASSSSGSFF